MCQLHLKVGTGPRSFEKSTKERQRQGGMSDKLLQQCLEKGLLGPLGSQKNHAMDTK